MKEMRKLERWKIKFIKLNGQQNQKIQYKENKLGKVKRNCELDNNNEDGTERAL